MQFALDRPDRDEPATGARTGRLVLNHGTVPTPVFMPVATQASVKAIWPEDLQALGYRMILGNSYHLFLRPGMDRIRAAGGLHRFMSWEGNILTDSAASNCSRWPRCAGCRRRGYAFSPTWTARAGS